MFAIYLLRNALVVLVLWLGVASASSMPRRPLKRVAHPSVLSLEILPRQAPPPKSIRARSSPPFPDSSILYHSDSFRLTLSAFNDVFHLHLRPNDFLIHPAARINYFKDGVLDRTVPILRESVRAYWGEVIATEHSPSRMREDAAGVLPRPSKQRGAELGWARIVVHSQGDAARGKSPIFEGAFEVNGETFHVQSRETYLRNKLALDPELVSGAEDPDSHLVIWRESDVVEDGVGKGGKNHGCTHDHLDFNTNPWRNPVLRKPAPPAAWYDPLGMLAPSDPYANSSLAVWKRDDVAGGDSSSNFVGSIGNTNGCPTTQKVVYMGVAADCAYVNSYGTTQKAASQIISNWNTASALYKQTFNISLGIIQLDVQDPSCPTTAPDDAPWNVGCDASNTTLNDRLSLFSAWRGQKGDDGTGLWHLMSGCPTGSEVGVAWLGTLCQQTASGNTGSVVSGTAVSTNGLTEWEVVSHEIGHNFGAIHDCQDGCTLTNQNPVCCPMTSTSCDANDAFIMSPVTSSSQKTFSQCTIGNICSLMVSGAKGGVNATCIVEPDPNKSTLSLNMCGNGIVESGEDCDPGQGTNSTCCDSSTCKFTNGAVCDPASSACCQDTCQFAPSSQVCRPAADANCDTAEFCTGNSSSCPEDVFQPNGQSCGSDGLACANGVCTSESQQCQIVGASLNLTTACSKQDSSCKVSCQDPTNSNQCVQLQSELIDGSSCGYGGTCKSGSCVAGSFLDTAKAWYVQNLQIAIPVTVVTAIVALLLLWGLYMAIRRCMISRKTKALSMEPALTGQRGMRIPSWQPPPSGAGAHPVMAARLPEVPVSTAPFMSLAPPVVSSSHPRRMSIPISLRPGNPVRSNTTRGPPSSYPRPPVSPRNQSWDGVYGRPPSQGSARMPPTANRGSRPGSSSSSRARQNAFPQEPAGARRMNSIQGRQRDQSNWVDPTLYNGPL